MRHIFTLVFVLSGVVLNADNLEQQINEMLSQAEGIDVVVKEVEIEELD